MRRTIVCFLLMCLISLIVGFLVAVATRDMLGLPQASHLPGGSLSAGLLIAINTRQAMPLLFHRLKFPLWTILLSGLAGSVAGVLGWLIAIHLPL